VNPHLLKSDQDGIESSLFRCRYFINFQLKSDQDGIERLSKDGITFGKKIC